MSLDQVVSKYMCEWCWVCRCSFATNSSISLFCFVFFFSCKQSSIISIISISGPTAVVCVCMCMSVAEGGCFLNQPLLYRLSSPPYPSRLFLRHSLYFHTCTIFLSSFTVSHPSVVYELSCIPSLLERERETMNCYAFVCAYIFLFVFHKNRV